MRDYRKSRAPHSRVSCQIIRVNWNSLGIFGNRAPFLLAFIPGVVLFRMMLVKWNLEKMGKGILAITVVGMLLVFFLVKSTNG